MQICHNGFKIYVFFMLSIILFLFTKSANGGALYSDKELLAAGNQYIETSTQWKFEQASHSNRMKRIQSMNISDIKKESLLRSELTRHTKRSHHYAGKRDQVQKILINETNARIKNSKGPSSGKLKATAGTKFGEVGHRGMYGDLDMGGGSNTANKVENVLQDMGLYDPKYKNRSFLEVDSKAGTLEIKGDFELTINKEGMKPRPGTEFHQIKTEVDARNPETYVSESMKTRSEGKLVKQQVGADYVEIQDHRKKASKGLVLDGDGLVKNPKKMQGMAKGTNKTLEMGQVKDETLEKILRQNGIKESPVEFKRKLQGIKEGKIKIDDPKFAEQMRRTSEDVFAAAEKTSFNKTKKNIVDLRAKAASKPPSDPVRRQIEDEIVDTVTKMKQTKAVNDEFLSQRSVQKKTPVLPDNPTVKNKITPDNVDVELKKINVADPPSVKQKAVKHFGSVMQIVDIGQTCQAVEDYMEGKKSLGEVTLGIVDQYATMGMISTGKHVVNTTRDYLDARSKIQQANRNNMTAYLTQWEVALRKTGISKAGAKKYISNVMLSGDLNLLERKARILRAQGKKIKSPKLVTETFEADDTILERAENLGKGMLTGIKDGVSYPLLAPSRMVEAYAEGELKEAHLEAYAKEQTASSRSTIFQKLISAGVDSGRALDAINAYEENDFKPLKALFKETRERIKKEQEAASAEAAAAEAEIKAKNDKISAGIKQYLVYLNFLRTAKLTLNHLPYPIELEQEGEPILVEFSLENNGLKFQHAANVLEKIIENISGAPGKVMIDYKLLIPNKKGNEPNTWFSKSPKINGIYPVTAQVDVKVGGAGLKDALVNLNQSFTREVFSPVEVSIQDSEYDYSKGIWPELKKTTVTSVSHGPYHYEANVGASGKINYEFTGKLTETSSYFGNIQITMSPDGKSIKQVIIETTSLEKGEALDKAKYNFKNFALYSLDKETTTRPVMAYYTASDEANSFSGTRQFARLVDDKWVWGEVTGSLYTPNIHFYMDDATKKQKWEAMAGNDKQKKENINARKKAASGGHFFTGPMGKDEGFEGTIEISIGKDNKSASGKFECKQEKQKGDKTTRFTIDGEFLGVFNPETGELEAKITKGSTFVMIKKDGKWNAGGVPRNMSNKIKIIGHLEGKQITGYMEKSGKKSFIWSALPAEFEEE